MIGHKSGAAAESRSGDGEPTFEVMDDDVGVQEHQSRGSRGVFAIAFPQLGGIGKSGRLRQAHGMRAAATLSMKYVTRSATPLADALYQIDRQCPLTLDYAAYGMHASR
jgi:hypothetical protein